MLNVNNVWVRRIKGGDKGTKKFSVKKLEYYANLLFKAMEVPCYDVFDEEDEEIIFLTEMDKKTFWLKGINFSLDDGYMMALLGKNGSGKTTLLKALYGMYNLKKGSIKWNNMETKWDKPAYHTEVAYIADEEWCFDELTVNENKDLLKIMYKNFDETEYENIMDIFDFSETDRDKQYNKLSTGQRMQFQLAFSLARFPKLVIMDEPLSNLDPIIKMDILELIRDRISRYNMGVIMSTHLVEEITDMTDYVGILENGEMKLFGDRESIFEQYGADSLRELITEGGRG